MIRAVSPKVRSVNPRKQSQNAAGLRTAKYVTYCAAVWLAGSEGEHVIGVLRELGHQIRIEMGLQSGIQLQGLLRTKFRHGSQSGAA